jgi:hypothetical protein
MPATAEQQRLEADRRREADWKQWGPYLSDRQWSTVREDYSPYGTAWGYFPHDHARSRAYRWGEDGLGGISDKEQYLCFALALWNGRDPILKERLFGLTGEEGNHGEDVKEYYFHLDSTPTHSYMKMLYKYPQAEFPYGDLVETNRRRSKLEPEYELLDTGVFAEDRYFDVFIEYAKAGPEDILIRISAVNRGPDPAELHLLPTLWFRNTWSWGDDGERPMLRRLSHLAMPSGNGASSNMDHTCILAEHPILGQYTLSCEGMPELLFTENETNVERLYGVPNPSSYVKDGIHEAVVRDRMYRVNPMDMGTKAAAHYGMTVPPGQTAMIRLRLTKVETRDWRLETNEPGQSLVSNLQSHDRIFAQRQAEADTFYADLQPVSLTDDERNVQRQAFAGMLWSKQFYYYDVDRWLRGDPGQPPPPPERLNGRNRDWRHLNTTKIISMCDKWEYPWFAAWDLAFHCVTLALVDAEFAKDQLVTLGREWYQHPNGQIPAYEWAFGDVNPPVLGWAAWRVYKIDQKLRGGVGDLHFLERVFHKLMLNFTWWVNRKDEEGRNVFQGGFLGLDNIGVFDRSAQLPTGGHIEQSDGTAWMGMFSLNMLTIALELSQMNSAYEDIAIKFFEHFLLIADAMNNIGGEGIGLWHNDDEFFYDVLHIEPDTVVPLTLRSMVGLIPLYAVTTIEPSLLDRLPEFRRCLEWFLENRPHLARLVSRWQEPGMGERRLLAILRGSRMKRVLRRMLDEREFLSPYGVRSISKVYENQPYVLPVSGMEYSVQYVPAESTSGLFGGNSNWRGPIWFPVNYLLIESLQQFHHYYSDDFRVEHPTGSGEKLSLWEIGDDLSRRLINIFLRDEHGRRPVFGGMETFQRNPHWRDLLLFNEYFHGDNGSGVGANHQTGWTGLVAKLIQQQGEQRDRMAALESVHEGHEGTRS